MHALKHSFMCTYCVPRERPSSASSRTSPHGVWLLVRSEELFMPFDDFPWFQDASVDALSRIEEPAPGHFYRPDLR